MLPGDSCKKYVLLNQWECKQRWFVRSYQLTSKEPCRLLAAPLDNLNGLTCWKHKADNIAFRELSRFK